MRRCSLTVWPRIFVLAALVAGGCEHKEPPASMRTPRIGEATSERLVLGGVDSRKIGEGEDLLGGWAPPRPMIGITRRPPPPVVREKTRDERAPDTQELLEPPAPTDEAAVAEEPVAEADAATATPTMTVALPRREEPPKSWYTPPPPQRGPYWTAMNVSIAIGAAGVAIGNTAAASDGALGDRVFALTCLGVGVAGFGTAYVLYLAEPAPKAGVNVSIAPGMIGVRGSF